MNRKAVLAALVAAVAGLAMLFLYMRRFEEEASGGTAVFVLAARQDLDIGVVLSRDMLISNAIPSSYVEDRHIPAGEVARVVGVRVTSRVQANESLLWTDLALATEQARNLSSLVQPGMRAITIRADMAASFGGLLRPGDRVDVLLTIQPEGRPHVTLPLLQNLLVLAAGRDTGAPERPGERRPTSGRGTVNQVTLSVTLEQSSVLSLAQQQGRLTLVLRNPNDTTVVERLPETTTADLIEAERRERVQRRRAPSLPEAPSEPQRVLTRP